MYSEQKYIKSIPEAVSQFDKFPDSAFIRPQVAKVLLGVSIATFWRLASKQAFPLHHPTERTTAVRAGDLRAFMNNQEEA